MVRQDKFKVGDKVTPHREGPFYFHGEFRDLFDREWIKPDGIYTVSKVVDVPYEPSYESGGQSNWGSMGHTQHISIAEDPEPSGDYPNWSGAWWALVPNDIKEN